MPHVRHVTYTPHPDGASNTSCPRILSKAEDSALKMEVVCTSEIPISTYNSAERYKPEDSHRLTDRRGDLRSEFSVFVSISTSP